MYHNQVDCRGDCIVSAVSYSAEHIAILCDVVRNGVFLANVLCLSINM